MLERYSGPAIALHWIIAVAIIGGSVLGHIMVDMRFSPTKLQYFSYHKWIGMTVFGLAVLRLAWRFIRKPPPPLPGQPGWQLRAAAVTHLVLYVLLFAIPISGWLYSSSTGIQTVYLGWLPIPDLIDKSPEWKDTLKTIHFALNRLLTVLVILHVLAAVKHALINRDGTLRRMLPGGKAA